MRSTLVITEAADDLQLLTIAEMRSAAGVSDNSQDAALKLRGLGVAAAIMSECNIAVGAGGEPTLRQETLTETFYYVRTGELVLARRHNVEIVSITVDGVDLTEDELDALIVDPEAGMITRVSTDTGSPCRWSARKMIVVYKAGFEEVPGDLKMAARDFFVAVSQGGGRDPFVKSETVEIPGLQTKRREYWVGSVPGAATEDAVPDVVSGQLKRYRISSLE